MTTNTASADKAAPAPPWASELAKALAEIFDRPEAAARCRRGLGKNPMEVPEMWQYCVPLAEAAEQTLHYARRDAEAAAHHVLTLYAVHQQSQETRMHQPGSASGDRRSVGTASRQLYGKRESEGVRQRFLAAATATSVPELAGHLRHLIPLLREEKIPLNYITLFRNIADWADPGRRGQVRRQWGLDFHRSFGRPADSSTPDNDDKEQTP